MKAKLTAALLLMSSMVVFDAEAEPVQKTTEYNNTTIVIDSQPCDDWERGLKAWAIGEGKVATGCWGRHEGYVIINLQYGKYFYDYKIPEHKFEDVDYRQYWQPL